MNATDLLTKASKALESAKLLYTFDGFSQQWCNPFGEVLKQLVLLNCWNFRE